RQFERRWLLAVWDTMLPSGAAPRLPIGARDVPMGRFLDEAERSLPLRMRFGLRLSLWVIVVFAPLLIGRARTFVGLAEADRIRALARLSASASYLLRETVSVVKLIGCLGYCGLPSVQARIGITPLDETPPEWAREAK